MKYLLALLLKATSGKASEDRPILTLSDLIVVLTVVVLLVVFAIRQIGPLVG